MAKYFDARGREVPEERIVREYVGRNREKVMQLLGVEKPRAAPRPFGIRIEHVEREGTRVVVVAPTEPAESRDL